MNRIFRICRTEMEVESSSRRLNIILHRLTKPNPTNTVYGEAEMNRNELHIILFLLLLPFLITQQEADWGRKGNEQGGRKRGGTLTLLHVCSFSIFCKHLLWCYVAIIYQRNKSSYIKTKRVAGQARVYKRYQRKRLYTLHCYSSRILQILSGN